MPAYLWTVPIVKYEAVGAGGYLTQTRGLLDWPLTPTNRPLIGIRCIIHKYKVPHNTLRKVIWNQCLLCGLCDVSQPKWDHPLEDLAKFGSKQHIKKVFKK